MLGVPASPTGEDNLGRSDPNDLWGRTRRGRREVPVGVLDDEGAVGRERCVHVPGSVPRLEEGTHARVVLWGWVGSTVGVDAFLRQKSSHLVRLWLSGVSNGPQWVPRQCRSRGIGLAEPKRWVLFFLRQCDGGVKQL